MTRAKELRYVKSNGSFRVLGYRSAFNEWRIVDVVDTVKPGLYVEDLDDPDYRFPYENFKHGMRFRTFAGVQGTVVETHEGGILAKVDGSYTRTEIARKELQSTTILNREIRIER